jgi:hypothetical protein
MDECQGVGRQEPDYQPGVSGLAAGTTNPLLRGGGRRGNDDSSRFSSSAEGELHLRSSWLVLGLLVFIISFFLLSFQPETDTQSLLIATR